MRTCGRTVVLLYDWFDTCGTLIITSFSRVLAYLHTYNVLIPVTYAVHHSLNWLLKDLLPYRLPFPGPSAFRWDEVGSPAYASVCGVTWWYCRVCSCWVRTWSPLRRVLVFIHWWRRRCIRVPSEPTEKNPRQEGRSWFWLFQSVTALFASFSF